ncbi:DUF2997 domain-containing protein [Phycisphaerales bacterium AB-hyl4]|uniref:DUF2997 domain-containing protein n=1 Tax=Natronomicrosphaera hydrolytica TaxID=3242702 RepID=A0ABV4U899_9BACT
MTSASRIIEITVSSTGQTKLETRGFAGPSCRDASRNIERALGLVESDQPTAEMHQSQHHSQQIDQQSST